MENKNFFQDLTRYRVKIEKDGKSVVDLPGIICLPGLLAAPRLSIAGIIAAPLLGYSVRLENKDGKTVDVENAVKKTAETIRETAAGTVRTIREEIDKAMQPASDNEPESEERKETADTEDAFNQATESIQDIAEDLEKHKADDIPTIQVNPDDSSQE